MGRPVIPIYSVCSSFTQQVLADKRDKISKGKCQKADKNVKKAMITLLTFKSLREYLREYLREFHYCAGVFAGPFAGLFAGVPLVGYSLFCEGSSANEFYPLIVIYECP